MAKLKNSEMIFSVVFIAIVLLLSIVFFVARSNAERPDNSTYQIVQLLGGQQFFGKLHGANSNHPKMTNVYYVQARGADETDPAKQNFILKKMGSEIHGPQDTLNFNPEHIVYWANLKTDSQVVQSIERDMAQKNGQISPVMPPQVPVTPVQPVIAPSN